MIKMITGEEPFQTINGNFSVSPSNEGYTLEYSTDGVSFTDWDEPVPANEVLIVTDVPLIPIFWKLKGNNSIVNVQM